MIQKLIALIAFMFTGALGFLQFDEVLVLSPMGHVIILGLLVVSLIVVAIVEPEVKLVTKRLYLIAFSFELISFLGSFIDEIWGFEAFLSSEFMMKLSMVLLLFPTILVNIIMFGLMNKGNKKKLEHKRVKKEKESPAKKLLGNFKKDKSKGEVNKKDVYFVLGVSADNADDE